MTERKFAVLYTKNDHKKRKVFHDGTLAVKPTVCSVGSTCVAQLIDDATGSSVCKVNGKDEGIYATGEEVIVGMYLVQIEAEQLSSSSSSTKNEATLLPTNKIAAGSGYGGGGSSSSSSSFTSSTTGSSSLIPKRSCNSASGGLLAGSKKPMFTARPLTTTSSAASNSTTTDIAATTSTAALCSSVGIGDSSSCSSIGRSLKLKPFVPQRSSSTASQSIRSMQEFQRASFNGMSHSSSSSRSGMDTSSDTAKNRKRHIDDDDDDDGDDDDDDGAVSGESAQVGLMRNVSVLTTTYTTSNKSGTMSASSSCLSGAHTAGTAVGRINNSCSNNNNKNNNNSCISAKKVKAFVGSATTDVRYVTNTGGVGCNSSSNSNSNSSNSSSTATLAVDVDPILARHMRPHQLYGAKFLINCLLGKTAVDYTSTCTASTDEGGGAGAGVIQCSSSKPPIDWGSDDDDNDDDDSKEDLTKLYTGAILADEMGLGKTLTSIAVLQAFSKPPLRSKGVIVCPASLIDNWVNEVKKWMRVTASNILYIKPGHDAKSIINTFSLSSINKYPMLILSYDLFRKHSTLLNTVSSFDLIVCDEGHRLKNAAGTKTISALENCKAKKRLILSGTPVQNNHEELYSMVSFVAPGFLGTLGDFRRKYSLPIERSRVTTNTNDSSNNSSNNIDLLRQAGDDAAQALKERVSRILLRRTRGVLSKFLPLRSEFVVYCDLAAGRQREAYAAEARNIFSSVGIHEEEVDLLSPRTLGTSTSFTTTTNSANSKSTTSVIKGGGAEVLSGLLNLRQCCNVAPPTITSCGGRSIGTSSASSTSTGDMMLGMLSSTAKYDENVHSNTYQQQQHLLLHQKKPPITSLQLKTSTSASTAAGITTLTARSSKLQFLSVFLRTMRLEAPDEKVVIVSNFMSALEAVGDMCMHMGFGAGSVLKLTGDVAMEDRAHIVSSFNKPLSVSTNSGSSSIGSTGIAEPFVLLLSAKAGGVGLNLIGASRLVMMDIDWNPATDQQAMGRIWREGQPKPVYIYRLICKDTIEEEMLHRQAKKLELADMVDDSSTTSSSSSSSSSSSRNNAELDLVELESSSSKKVKIEEVESLRELTPQKLVQLIYPRYSTTIASTSSSSSSSHSSSSSSATSPKVDVVSAMTVTGTAVSSASTDIRRRKGGPGGRGGRGGREEEEEDKEDNAANTDGNSEEEVVGKEEEFEEEFEGAHYSSSGSCGSGAGTGCDGVPRTATAIATATASASCAAVNGLMKSTISAESYSWSSSPDSEDDGTYSNCSVISAAAAAGGGGCRGSSSVGGRKLPQSLPPVWEMMSTKSNNTYTNAANSSDIISPLRTTTTSYTATAVEVVEEKEMLMTAESIVDVLAQHDRLIMSTVSKLIAATPQQKQLQQQLQQQDHHHRSAACVVKRVEFIASQQQQ